MEEDERGYSEALWAKMAEQGWQGLLIPEAYGGAGMDFISFAILCEELERADTAFRVVQSVHVGLNSLALLQWGTEEQKQRWLPGILDASEHWCQGFTEPQAGSDLANLRTLAIADGDA